MSARTYAKGFDVASLASWQKNTHLNGALVAQAKKTHEKQSRTMQTKLFEDVIDVMRPCPYCGRLNLVISEEKYDNNTFFSITHSDFHLGWKKRPCGILISHYNKEELIEWYNSMEWTKQDEKYI